MSLQKRSMNSLILSLLCRIFEILCIIITSDVLQMFRPVSLSDPLWKLWKHNSCPKRETNVCACVCELVILVGTDTETSSRCIGQTYASCVKHTHTHKEMHFLHCDFSVLFCKRHTFFFLNLNSYSISWMQCNHRAFQRVNKLAVLTQVSPQAKSF